MEYRVIKGSGRKISTIGIGSGYIHESNEKQTVELLDFAQAQGINFIDLATSYPEPWAHYGVALRGRREQFCLQLHLGITFEGGAYARDYSLEAMKRSFEAQLKETGSDYADIAVFHCVDTMEDYRKLLDGGGFDYALSLKRAGAIRNLGFASHTVAIANQFIGTGEMDSMMFSVNPAYDFDPAGQDPYGEDSKNRGGLAVSLDRQKLYQDCETRGIAMVVMKAYGGGKLLDAKTSPFGRALTPAQCLRYALDRPAALSCVVGVAGLEDLKEAVKLYTASEEALDYSFIAETRPTEMKGACVYCNHCMPCPAGINIGQTMKFLDLYFAGDELAKMHYLAMEHQGSDCLSCGVCILRCPFGANPRAAMQKARERF